MTQRLMFVPSLTVGHAHNDRWGYSAVILRFQSYKGGRNFTGLILGVECFETEARYGCIQFGQTFSFITFILWEMDVMFFGWYVSIISYGRCTKPATGKTHPFLPTE